MKRIKLLKIIGPKEFQLPSKISNKIKKWQDNFATYQTLRQLIPKFRHVVELFQHFSKKTGVHITDFNILKGIERELRAFGGLSCRYQNWKFEISNAYYDTRFGIDILGYTGDKLEKVKFFEVTGFGAKELDCNPTKCEITHLRVADQGKIYQYNHQSLLIKKEGTAHDLDLDLELCELKSVK